MKLNAILGLTLLLGSFATGETVIRHRSYGSYVHNAKCPQFHFNDTTVFHVNPEHATLQVFMGTHKQTPIPYVHADEILKKSSYRE